MQTFDLKCVQYAHVHWADAHTVCTTFCVSNILEKESQVAYVKMGFSCCGFRWITGSLQEKTPLPLSYQAFCPPQGCHKLDQLHVCFPLRPGTSARALKATRWRRAKPWASSWACACKSLSSGKCHCSGQSRLSSILMPRPKSIRGHEQFR